MAIELHRHVDGTALDAALAELVLERLREGIYRRGRASLAVSGGRTPAGLFRRLAASPFPWHCVTVTLADERWVPPSHADSNERMVREVLLRDAAAAAHFVPLYNGAADPTAGLAACAAALAAIPRPFDVVLLGMGEDGHTASLFPAAASAPLDTAAVLPDCRAVRPTHAAHARLSLSPAALLDTRLVALHFTGAAKWSVLCDALKPGPLETLPVRHVLHQDQVACRVYWTH
jgi:6-phosphogluconolactonase